MPRFFFTRFPDLWVTRLVHLLDVCICYESCIRLMVHMYRLVSYAFHVSRRPDCDIQHAVALVVGHTSRLSKFLH